MENVTKAINDLLCKRNATGVSAEEIAEAIRPFLKDQAAKPDNDSQAATPLVPEPGEGHRLLDPTEVIQRGDEWKCEGTGCPDFRTLNAHYGQTVAQVNAVRHAGLQRIYRRKLS